jgi:hypothetical protein
MLAPRPTGGRRPDEARAKAAEMTDAANEASMLTIARLYEEMADRAAKRKANTNNKGRLLKPSRS